MNITDRDLDELVDAGVIDTGAAGRIAAYRDRREETVGRFDLTHLAYYLGAAIVLVGLFWFMHEAWARYGGMVLAVTAVLYGVVFTALGERFWRQRGYRVPGGLLFTTAVAMAPLLLFGVLNAAGLWPDRRTVYTQPTYFQAIHGHTISLELGTIGAALIALRLRPFPFMMVPLGVAFWLLSMDAAPLLVGDPGGMDGWRLGSVSGGLIMLGAAYGLDRTGRAAYATWLYLVGLSAFWIPLLTDFDFDFGFALVNVALLLAALLLQRKAFLVYGGLGIFAYLGELVSDVFRDSLLFPAALSAIGLGFILFGVWYNRRADAIRASVLRRLPPWLRRALPRGGE